MAKRTEKEVVDETVEVVEEETVEETASGDKDSATVTWRGQSRVYSRDLHGKEFKALAKEFAEKKGGTVV